MYWSDGRAQIRHTNHSALQHDHVQPSNDDLILGVVRETMYGLDNVIDRNHDELGPPRDLLHDLKREAAKLGHNRAVDTIDFKERYLNHLQSERAQNTIQAITEEVQSGTTVWLVCYENVEDKFCHRLLLVREIQDRL